jgi:hypothetical protein
MAHRMTTHTDSRRITRDDLEAKFQGLQDDLQGRVESKKRTVLGTAAGVGVVLLLLVFLLGRRSGKKKTTMVEIRRF